MKAILLWALFITSMIPGSFLFLLWLVVKLAKAVFKMINPLWFPEVS